MRMIVEAFKETLELGLQKPDQVVVRLALQAETSPFGVDNLAPYGFAWGTLLHQFSFTRWCYQAS